MSGSPNTQKMKEKIRLIMEKCAQREDLEKIRKITIGGLELYRTTAYTRKSDSTRVLAYYDMQQGIGFRVELKEQIEVIEMKKRKKKTVKIEDAERKEKQDTSQAIRQAKPGRETLKAAMQDSLVKLNYQTMIDATAEIFGAPVVKRRFTKEEISIPILYMDGRYRTVTSLLREISTIFYPEINGAKCTIHDSRRETFIDRKSGRVVRGEIQNTRESKDPEGEARCGQNTGCDRVRSRHRRCRARKTLPRDSQILLAGELRGNIAHPQGRGEVEISKVTLGDLQDV